MATVNFFSIAYNRPDFITLQYQTLKKQWDKLSYTNQDFTFEVIINTKDRGMQELLIEACRANSLNFAIVPIKDKELYNGGLTAYNYVREVYFPKTPNGDLSVIFDADMFFYAPLDVHALMEGYDVAAIYHQREKKILGFTIYNYEYLWVGFMVFKHKNINWQSLRFDPVKNICDVGGMTAKFLKQETKKGLKVKWLNHTADITHEYKEIIPGTLQKLYKPTMGFQLIENAIIHYYRGSNWDGSNEALIRSKNSFLAHFLEWTNHNTDHIGIGEHYNQVTYSSKHFNGIVDNKKANIKPSY